MNRYNGYEFERFVVKYYFNKINSCKLRKIEFNLTIMQVRNMLSAKKCQLTEIQLTHNGAGSEDGKAAPVQRNSDVTIDRLDSSRPYETGNVAACSHFANVLKNGFECSLGGGLDSIKAIHLMSKNLKKRGF